MGTLGFGARWECLSWFGLNPDFGVEISPGKLHPLLEEKDLKNDRPKNYFVWTFAAHMTQILPKKYNFTQFAVFFHFLFIKVNSYFV